MRHLVLLLASASALAACNRSQPAPAGDAPAGDSLAAALPPGHVPVDQPAAATTLSVRSQALLDSGNAAFRRKDYQGALAYYAKSAQESPTHAAPWFGTYMVGQAMKDSALADSAMRMVRQRAPEMQSHPTGTPQTVPTPLPGSPHRATTPSPRTS